jgi:hypothetical protein
MANGFGGDGDGEASCKGVGGGGPGDDATESGGGVKLGDKYAAI